MAVVVTCSAPSSAEENADFVVSGIVYDSVSGLPYVGNYVEIFVNGSLFGSATTGVDGDYLDTISIPSAGTYDINARTAGVFSNTEVITITAAEPEPEPGWEFRETYRGIDIYVWMPDGTPFTAYYDGSWHTAAFISTIKAGIDNFLEPPPTEGVTVYLEPSLNRALLEFRYRSYGLDEFIYSKLSVDGKTEWPQGAFTNYDIFQVRFPPQTVGGVSYLEARTSTFMYQNAPLVYTLNLQEAEVVISTTLTLSAPDRAMVEEKFNVSGILYETESGIPIPYQPINHSYNGRSLGGSTTGVDGDYLKEVSIPEAGTWTIKSEFPGTEALKTSRALVDAVVGETPIGTALLIAGPIVTGIALFIYGIS